MFSIFSKTQTKHEKKHCDVSRRTAAENELKKVIRENDLYPVATGAWRIEKNQWTINLYSNSRNRLELVVSFIEGLEHIEHAQLNHC